MENLDVKLCVRMRRDQYKKLIEKAKEKGYYTVSELVRELIREFLKEGEQK